MYVKEKVSNEKRLIDANALIKEANEDGAYGYVDAFQIANAPTVDAVEVIRCRECENHLSSAFYPDMVFCTENRRYMNPDGFCSYGYRKEGDD